MTEHYDGPIFDKVIDSGNNGVAINGAYLEQPQGRVCDLAPDEWFGVSSRTVYYDEETRQLVINTYNSPQSSLSISDIDYSPFVGRLLSSQRDNPELAYAVDLRRVRSYMYPTSTLRLEDGEDNVAFEKQKALAGAALARVAIVRYFDEVHYFGPKNFLLAAQDFVQSVDEYVTRLDDTSLSLQQPYYNRRITDFHTTHSQLLTVEDNSSLKTDVTTQADNRPSIES